MNHKQMPRLGSAIASTVLSVFWAVSLVGVDKAQAAVLDYTFRIENGGGDGFFTVDNSSLTGIGVEYVTVSYGRFYGLYPGPLRISDNHSYNDLTHRAGAVFYQGVFRGLSTGDDVNGFSYQDYFPGESPQFPNGGLWMSRARASWEITTSQSDDPTMWTSRISGYLERREEITGRIPGYPLWTEIYESREDIDDAEVYYTLVPEPLTAGGTALALAGLSWLKHKKKKAA
jgi:hypothetical protein